MPLICSSSVVFVSLLQTLYSPIHFIIFSAQVCQVTQQNPKTAWRVLVVPVVSLVQWVSLEWSGSRVCREFAKRGTAAFMHRWHAKSRVWWKDLSLQKSEPEHEHWDILEDLRDTWWKRLFIESPADIRAGFKWEENHFT